MHQALREARDLTTRLKAKEGADLQRIAALEREVTQLQDDNRKAEIVKLQLEEDLQDQKDQIRQCESNLRNALHECKRWHAESVETQSRIQELEGRLQRMPLRTSSERG